MHKPLFYVFEDLCFPPEDTPFPETHDMRKRYHEELKGRLIYASLDVQTCNSQDADFVHYCCFTFFGTTFVLREDSAPDKLMAEYLQGDSTGNTPCAIGPYPSYNERAQNTYLHHLSHAYNNRQSCAEETSIRIIETLAEHSIFNPAPRSQGTSHA